MLKRKSRLSTEKEPCGPMFTLEHLGDHMYLLRFSDRYLLNMAFLRASEYCESSKLAGVNVTIPYIMSVYSRGHSTAKYPTEGSVRLFTYPTDWAGFNIKSETLDTLYPEDRSLSPIPDWNHHDDLINGIVRTIRSELRPEKKFYLLGVTSADGKEEGNVLKHEMAHGFYYLDSDYHAAQLEVINSMQDGFRHKLSDILYRMSYGHDVFADEAQAYLSTGHANEMTRLSRTTEWKRLARQCKKIFNDRLKQEQ